MQFFRIRAYTGAETFGIMKRLWRVFEVGSRIGYMRILVVVLATVVLLAYLILKVRGSSKIFLDSIPYLLIALIPCAWCFLCAGHAGHGWTQWLYSISIFSVFQFLWDCYETGVGKIPSAVRESRHTGSLNLAHNQSLIYIQYYRCA